VLIVKMVEEIYPLCNAGGQTRWT